MLTLISRLLTITYNLMIRITLRAYRVFTRALSWNPPPTDPKKPQPDQLKPKSYPNPRVEDKYCVIDMEGASSCQLDILAGTSESRQKSEAGIMGHLSPAKKPKNISDMSSDKPSVEETPTVVATTTPTVVAPTTPTATVAADTAETTEVDIHIVEFSNDHKDPLVLERMHPQPLLTQCQMDWSLSSTQKERSSEMNPGKRSKSKKPRRKNKSRDLAPFSSKRITSSRPNFFIGIQIKNVAIKSNITTIQEKILTSEITTPSIREVSRDATIFKDSMIAVEKLHFTLHVVNIKEPESPESAARILEKCFDEVKKTIITDADPLHLCIEGLGHFGNAVLFAKIKGDGHINKLESVSQLLRKEFGDMNISGEESKAFKPHMTVAKMSKSKTLQKKGVRSYPAEIWSQFANEHIGFQKVESLQLLSMTEPADPITGYYKCHAEFFF